MSGICGFTEAYDSDNDRKTLKAMCDAMAHRGPDGEGRYFDSRIALGYRRLALIGFDDGDQPMVRATGDLDSDVISPDLAGGEAVEGDEARVAAIGDWAIVFNGEIYNYRELRDELAGLGYRFKTSSDTEVLLVGYIAWAEEVLSRLRGMFAFAIWHRTSGQLFCARDFFGIKPFYYAITNVPGRAPAEPTGTRLARRQDVFASEIKSILEHPAYKRDVNEAALAQYLCFQFSALPETFFKGIFSLPQGHFMRVSADGKVEVVRYWHPSYEFDASRVQNTAADALSKAVRDSVHYHSMADGEVGTLLSSGVDSSYLTACLKQENPHVKTFTGGFAEYEGALDEVAWARELAEQLRVENEVADITEQAFWDAIPLVQWHMDEPLGDPSAVALYFVDQMASRRVKAVLSGEGADELFGGYPIYQASLANAMVRWMPTKLLRAGSDFLRATRRRGANFLRRAATTVEDWYYTNANGIAFTEDERDRVLSASMRARLGIDSEAAAERARNPRDHAREGVAERVVASSGGHSKPGAASVGRKRVRDEASRYRRAGLQAPPTAQYGHVPSPQDIVAPTYAEVADLDDVSRMQHVDVQHWLVGNNLLKADKMAMANSLELRVPFLDREVFRIAATVPTSQRVSVSQTKLVLRQAAAGAIPTEWARKEKMGFPMPVAEWLREENHYLEVKREFTSAESMRFFDVGELLALLDAHFAGEADYARRIWIVYMFLVWYRIYFVDREKPALFTDDEAE